MNDKNENALLDKHQDDSDNMIPESNDFPDTKWHIDGNPRNNWSHGFMAELAT